MALPQAVEEQERLADELIKGQGQEPPVELAEVVESVPPLQADPAPEPDPEPKPERKRIDPEDYKERYTSLRSHRDAELISAQKERDAMAAQLEAQGRERNALMARMADMDEAAQRAQGLPADVLSEDEIALVGEDAIPALTKVARAVAEQQTSRLNRQVNDLTTALKQRDHESQQTRQDAYNVGFKGRLLKAMPNAEQIDADPEFHVWLDGRDDLSGITRRELAGRAWQNSDVGRVVSLYSEWQAETGGLAAAEVPDPRAGKIMPGRVADKAPEQTETRQWNSGTIARFYDDWRRGKYKEAEAVALERDLFKAQAEGRIR